MLSGNGTIDYDVEAHTLDAHETSAARQESTTKNLHGSAAIDINTHHLDSKPVSTRQARIANLQRQIESLDKKLMRLEEDFESEENDESYERTLGRRRRLAEVLEELRLDRSYDDTTSTIFTTPRRPTNPLQGLSKFNTNCSNYNLKNSSCQNTSSAQERSKLILRSASPADVNATVPLGKVVNPLDNLTTTDYKWYTPGMSYSGSSPAITEGHSKPLYIGPTQDSKCVQQNNYEQYSILPKKNKFTTTRNFTIPKLLPKTPTFDHIRNINKGYFNPEANKANLQGKVRLLHTDESISDKVIRRSDPYITASHNYVAPAHTTCKVLDDIENADISEPYDQHQGQELSLETKESKIDISEERENNIYDVPSDTKERTTGKNNNISTRNGKDISECTQHYELHDVQLFTHSGNLKKCQRAHTTHNGNETYITHPFHHNHTSSLDKHLHRAKQSSKPWKDKFSYPMNKLNFCKTEHISKPYVAPDDNGYLHNNECLLIRPSRCY